MLESDKLVKKGMHKTLSVDSNKVFLLIFSIWLFFDFFQRSTLSFVFGYYYKLFSDLSNWVVLTVLFIVILFQKYHNLKELACILLISIVITISVARSHNVSMMSLWLFILSSQNLDIEDCVKRSYIISMVVFPIIVALFLLGIIPEISFYRGNLLRHSLGFVHPNVLGISMFQVILCHFFLRRNKLHIGDYFFAFIMTVFLYVVPNAKASVVVSIFMIIFFACYSILKKRCHFRSFFSKLLFSISLCINIISIYFGFKGIYNSNIAFLDRFISNRLSLIHKTYLYYGIKWFGQKIYTGNESISKLGFYMNGDNAYMYVLIEHGIIIYILFYVFYYMNMYYYMKYNMIDLLIVYSLFAFVGLMQNEMCFLSYNTFLLLLPHYFKKNTPKGCCCQKI